MIKDITLGQFFPGDSIIHKLDPRMKIIIMVLFITGVFFAANLPSFAFMLAFVMFLCLLSKISVKVILKGLKPIVFIAVFTAVINIFWTTGDTALFEYGIIKIYPEGIWRSIYMIVRIVALVAGTSILLTYTTSPMELTDGIERLFSPLNKLRVPVHEFSMMMTLALRFVPTLIEETEKIMDAQKARGADFESGGLKKRAKALIPVLIPLFISAIRRATDLAVAMECRCYTGGEGRTRLKQMRLKAMDFVALAFALAFIAVMIMLLRVNIPWGNI